MESFVKSDDLEFPSDSPTYDFVTGFEHISGSFIPDHDSSSMYHYADISPASSSSPPGHAMSIDSNYPAPPRLSNNHRQARFLKGGAWSVADTSQRSPLPGNARPYGSQVRLQTGNFFPSNNNFRGVASTPNYPRLPHNGPFIYSSFYSIASFHSHMYRKKPTSTSTNFLQT